MRPAVVGQILATIVLIALAFVSRHAPIGLLLLVVAFLEWALAFFGDELSPFIGVHSTPEAAPYVSPVVRGIGWLFLLATSALAIARAAHLL
jgi:hypothetical protein